MPLVKVPEEHYQGLALIVALNDQTAGEFITALEQASPKLYPSDIVVEIGPKIPSIKPDDLETIVDTLHTLYLTKLHHELSPESLAEDVCEALAEDEEQDTGFTSENREVFKERLTRLLNIESLTVLAKAFSVFRNQENMYCTARIVTDIRAVFGSNPEAPPPAAVLIHMVNLSYHHEGKLRDFYLALDADNVQELREVLDRADIKAKSLRSLLRGSKVVSLDAEANHYGRD